MTLSVRAVTDGGAGGAASRISHDGNQLGFAAETYWVARPSSPHDHCRPFPVGACLAPPQRRVAHDLASKTCEFDGDRRYRHM